MSAVPYMKFYIGDYLGDTQHLTTLQHGAYLLLIMAYWQHRGPLPADDEKLARIARCTPDEWMQCKDDVVAFFSVCKCNANALQEGYKDDASHILVHDRIERELKGIMDISEKRRRSAYKKWETLPKTDAFAMQVHSECIANGMLSHIHIPYSHSDKEEDKENMHLSPISDTTKKDGCKRIEDARAAWNNSKAGPPCRLTALSFSPEDREECLRTMTAYSDQDILEAIRNYATIKKSEEHEVTAPYRSFAGFMRGGVEKFVTGADPFEAYRKRKRFETAQEREDKARAEALEYIKELSNDSG